MSLSELRSFSLWVWVGGWGGGDLFFFFERSRLGQSTLWQRGCGTLRRHLLRARAARRLSVEVMAVPRRAFDTANTRNTSPSSGRPDDEIHAL